MSEDEHTEAPEESWATLADWFIARIAEGWTLHEFVRDSLVAALPTDLTGMQLLDVGCGEGSISRELAGRGGTVLGIDNSERMITAAITATPTGIDYLVDDGTTLSEVPDHCMDWVTAGMALNNLSDLSRALGSIRRVLVPGGRLAFTVPHPCFEAPHSSWVAGRRLIGDYLTEGFWRSREPSGVRRAGNHHRTVSTYVMALIAAGFAIDTMAEPEPPQSVLAEQPHRAGLPPFLLMTATSTNPSSQLDSQ